MWSWNAGLVVAVVAFFKNPSTYTYVVLLLGDPHSYLVLRYYFISDNTSNSNGNTTIYYLLPTTKTIIILIILIITIERIEIT